MKTLYFEEALPQSGSSLTVLAAIGAVTILPGHGRLVTVAAELENAVVTVEGSGHNVTVRSEIERADAKSEVKLVIHVPADCAVQVNNHLGSVQVREIDAPVTTRVTTGRTSLADIGGPVYAKTTTGELTYDGLLPTADHRFETVTGNVQLRLLQTPNAQLSASTITGKVSCEFPLTERRHQRHLTGGKLLGILGTGEGRLKAKVTTGSLTLAQQNRA